MKVGLIGVGTVGSTLRRWLANNTHHELACYDPAKNFNDNLTGCDAIFVSVPVPPADGGQDLSTLIQAVHMAKRHTENVFIRSTVLPGTNDALKTIACPEFLTARFADRDMANLPVLVGEVNQDFVAQIFTGKIIYSMKNVECEIAKFAHNCFGALKVTFFNSIYNVCGLTGANYENVKTGFLMSGLINDEHTSVPGPDGKFGYGGTCFPGNVEAWKQFMSFTGLHREFDLIRNVQNMNRDYRIELQQIADQDKAGEVDA